MNRNGTLLSAFTNIRYEHNIRWCRLKVKITKLTKCLKILYRYSVNL